MGTPGDFLVDRTNLSGQHRTAAIEWKVEVWNMYGGRTETGKKGYKIKWGKTRNTNI
jgi:hypothetical protein